MINHTKLLKVLTKSLKIFEKTFIFSRAVGPQQYLLKTDTLTDIFVEQFEEQLFYRTRFGSYFLKSELNICIINKTQRTSLSLVFKDILS